MGWSTLTGNADYVRTGNADVLDTTNYPDATLEQLNLTDAKAELEIDLADALGLDQNETDDLDDVLDLTRNMKIVQKALAYLQLKYFYMENMTLDGINEFRFNYYEKQYKEYKKRFFGQLLVRGNNAKVTYQSIRIG